MPKHSSDFNLPGRGIVFWPVGNDDCTTITVDDEVIVQIDLNNLSDAEEGDDSYVPVIERIIEQLPKVDNKTYLSVFVLTHPDHDHHRGFADLLDQVKIGKLWFAPRVFREYSHDLSLENQNFGICNSTFRYLLR